MHHCVFSSIPTLMLEDEIERIERFFLCVCYFSGLKFCRIICLISEVLKGLTRALMAKSNSGFVVVLLSHADSIYQRHQVLPSFYYLPYWVSQRSRIIIYVCIIKIFYCRSIYTPRHAYVTCFVTLWAFDLKNT